MGLRIACALGLVVAILQLPGGYSKAAVIEKHEDSPPNPTEISSSTTPSQSNERKNSTSTKSRMSHDTALSEDELAERFLGNVGEILAKVVNKGAKLGLKMGVDAGKEFLLSSHSHNNGKVNEKPQTLLGSISGHIAGGVASWFPFLSQNFRGRLAHLTQNWADSAMGALAAVTIGDLANFGNAGLAILGLPPLVPVGSNTVESELPAPVSSEDEPLPVITVGDEVPADNSILRMKFRKPNLSRKSLLITTPSMRLWLKRDYENGKPKVPGTIEH